MIAGSAQWRTTPESMMAASIIQGIGPQKYERNLSTGFLFFSGISLYPYSASRSCTSDSVKPASEKPNRGFTASRDSWLPFGIRSLAAFFSTVLSLISYLLYQKR
jgi:hypothetical protein